VRNQADGLVYSTEKFLADNSDKVTEDVKSEVSAAVAEVKTALEADDLDAIKTKSEALATISQKMGQSLYDANAAASAGGAPADAEGGNDDDNVVDAEIVEDSAEDGSSQ
jgi:molecular chaperone DnaK